MDGFVDMAVPLVVGLFGFVVVLIIIKASSQSKKNDDAPEK
jgi:hypothetical protein